MPDSPAELAVPSYCPTSRELDDLELLANGALAPLSGFEADGAVTLHVPRSVGLQAARARAIELTDPEGAPLGRVMVESTYAVGTLTGIVGPVTDVRPKEYGAFRHLYLSPGLVKSENHANTLTVPISGPLTCDDLEAIRTRAAGRHVLLLALTGAGTPEGLSAPGLIRATLAAAQLLGAASTIAVPLATRGDHERDQKFRESVVHAYAPGEVMRVPETGELPGEVAQIVDFERPARSRQGLVVFFTGLSGSGKSTLARALHDVVLEHGERTVTSLDGDVVRRNLSAGLTFSKEDRETNIRRIGWVAAEISRHGGVAICSPIAPFDSTRKQVRSMVQDAGGAFVLIHVATSLEECERRDRKGLYAKARRGEIPEFTGISSPYEEPDCATVRVDTTGRSIDDALGDVLKVLHDAGYLSRTELPSEALQ